jgi:acetyltransferase-like isoleucine patch superfamily enzyme
LVVSQSREYPTFFCFDYTPNPGTQTIVLHLGFKAIVFNAWIGRGSYISMDAVVTYGVRIAPNRFVPPGAHIDTQAKAASVC